MAQQPAFFVLGEDEFRGIQIYDVIQDVENNYWFATNEGIYCYNYTTFERIECHKAKSNSAFNFVMDKQGRIYCHNLNRQIFQIQDKKCSLFYELAEEETSSDVSLAIANDGNVLIGAKKIIVVSPEGKVLKRSAFINHYLGPPSSVNEKMVLYHLNNSDSAVCYANGSFFFQKLDRKGQVFKFIRSNGKYFAIDLMTKESYAFEPARFHIAPLPHNELFDRTESFRVYETSKGLWLAGTLPGAFHLKDRLTNAAAQIVYENYFISDVFVDSEGNTLLSTFDKGVLVVPDLQVADVINSFRDDPITTLYSLDNEALIFGSSKGKLMSYGNGRLDEFSNMGTRPIEVIEGTKERMIYDDGMIRGYNRVTGERIDILVASLKSAVYIGDDQYFLGTNRGVVKIAWNGSKQFNLEWIEELKQRVHFIAYDSNSETLYVSTADGLYSKGPRGKARKLLYAQADIFPNDLHFFDGKLYMSTKEDGVLIFEKGKLTKEIRPMVNGKLQTLKKMIVHQHTIIANSTDGLYQFDMNGKLLRSFHTVFGFSSKRVIDFTFHKNELWVSHSGGVQKIKLNYAVRPDHHLQIRFDKILVNGSEHFEMNSGHLTSDQRKVQFKFTLPTLRNRELIRYHFRLIGLDSNWTINNYELNQVTYNALSPGHYEFQVKAEYQGGFSKLLTYKFDVSAPFYIRWWFIAILTLAFLGLVYLIYKRQLALQNKKAQQINELNASKLTAIQSQMNPHFIFNSLNSIQDLILKGDVEHSYSYITTFSNLVRRTLNYSEKDFIDFEQEIKLLELYLSLEKLRFKKDFNYTIRTNNVEDILLPPLLVQPFIENALIHGLLHKEGQKDLVITFELKEDLICTIEDNGIGREKAKAIKLRQRSEHESFSGKAIQHRFEILSKVFEGKFGYTYEDLYENEVGIGTRVILTIPIKHKF
jgi:ligand-binding sensor domain-containing protein